MYYKVILLGTIVALSLPAFPPVLTPFFQPYTFGKTVLFELVVEGMALLYAASFLRGNVLPRGKLVTAVALFMLAATLSTLFSLDPQESFRGSSARMDGLFTLLHVGAFFLVLAGTIRTREHWHNLIRWSAGLSAFVALYGIAQWFELPFVRASEGTIFSTLGNPTYFATYALFHLFLALLCARQASSRESQALWGIVSALNALMILLTSVSGVFLGLTVGTLVAAYPWLRARAFSKKGAVALGAAVCVSALGIYASPVLRNLAPTAPANASALESRVLVWRTAGAAALEHPLLGHGPNQFEATFLAYKARGYPVPATGETFDKPHNAFLEIIFSFGVVGMLAYLYLLKTAYAALAAGERQDQRLVRGALTGYLVSLLFFFETTSSLTLFVFILAYLARAHQTPLPQEQRIPRWAWGFAPLALILFFAVFHFKPLYAAWWANQGVKNEALRYQTFNTPFIERAFELREQK